MKREDNIGIWMATGIAGAILLGIALIPLREVTSASKFGLRLFGLDAFYCRAWRPGGRRGHGGRVGDQSQLFSHPALSLL